MNMLVSASAIAAAPAIGLASSLPDPIIAAIDKHRVAHAALNGGAAEHLWDGLFEAEQASTLELLNCSILTLPGAAAFSRYVAEHGDMWCECFPDEHKRTPWAVLFQRKIAAALEGMTTGNVLASSPSIAPRADSGDPIFAVIADHRSAMIAWLLALKIEGETEDQEPARADAARKCEAAFEAKCAADEALVGIVPATQSGVVALLQYADDLCAHRVAVPGFERSHFCEVGLLGQDFADDDIRDAMRDRPLSLPFLYWIGRNARIGLEGAYAA